MMYSNDWFLHLSHIDTETESNTLHRNDTLHRNVTLQAHEITMWVVTSSATNAGAICIDAVSKCTNCSLLASVKFIAVSSCS
jgi:hypothetical protein